MATPTGRSFTLMLGSGTSVTAVAQMRSTGFEESGEPVEVTNKDSGGKRTLLEGAGTSALTVNAAGVVDGTTGIETLLSRVGDKSLNPYQINWNDGGKIEFSGQVTNFSASGEHNGEQIYSLRIESSGAWTNTAT